jgi:hypothetical protein
MELSKDTYIHTSEACGLWMNFRRLFMDLFLWNLFSEVIIQSQVTKHSQTHTTEAIWENEL